MTPFALIAGQPTLRGIGLALLALGAYYASVFPYQSLIGIKTFGLTELQFGLVMVLASVVAVTTSVLLGVRSDQRANRRGLAVATGLVGAVGVGAMLLTPGPVSLVICHGICLPVTASLYGQIFALTRLATQDHIPKREAILSTLRAAMSVSFTAMLVLWTVAFAFGWAGIMAVYVGSALSLLVLLGLFQALWPRDGRAGWAEARSTMTLADTFRDLARPPVLLRLICLGVMSGSGLLNLVLIGLIFAASDTRGTGEIALFIALIAAWEVPFMLLLPRLIGRVPRSVLLAAGSTLFGVQMVMMPWLVDTPLLWLMPVLAGMGGTAVITLPITYFQDLMAGRPGTAGAMLALQRLIGDVTSAAAFVLGTALGGYGLTAGLGAGLAVLAAGVLLRADRRATAS